MRAASRQRIGRILLPPANTLYRIARWIDEGGVFSGGIRLLSAASTMLWSASKKSGSFMRKVQWQSLRRPASEKPRSRFYDDSSSGSNGSATIFPSAFFSKISTRPSASSSCFWHSRESFTPSSKSRIASSSDKSALSSRFTTSSSRVSDFSKSPFFGASTGTADLFGAGLILPRSAQAASAANVQEISRSQLVNPLLERAGLQPLKPHFPVATKLL